MSATNVPSYRYFRGLCTREAEEGGASPDRWRVCQNVRVGGGGAKRRAGSTQTVLATSDHTAVNLNGTTQYFRIGADARIHTLGLYWTWECLVIPDIVNARQVIFGGAAGGTPPLVVEITSSGFPKVTLTLSDSSTAAVTSNVAATAGAALGIQVVRSAGTLTLRQSNSVFSGTASPGAALSSRAASGDVEIGRDNATAYFDGKIDYIRAFSIARDSHADWRLRFTDPRCDYCLYNYVGHLDSNTWMRDLGRYEAHAQGKNTPTETAAIAVSDAMANGIHGYLDRSGRRRVAYGAGGLLFLMTP